MRKIMGLLVIGALSLGSGCASAFVTTLAPTPYGGLRADAELFKHAPLFAAVDILPSAALDTVLLPVTVSSAVTGKPKGLIHGGRFF